MSTDTSRADVASVEAAALDAFVAGLLGDALRPGDPGYDEARRLWNGMIDRRPGLIVRAAGAADVIAAVSLAREHGLLLAVRGGGHNVAGTASCDGGLVIDLTRMRDVRVDPVGRTARAGGGATWRDVDHECQAFGLATAGGVVSMTGIAGLTLGGGLGWLRRKHGLSCDNLVSVDLVTADGRLLTASETEHPDLFWAVRGGGGNFGVVTSFEYRLHPVGPIVSLCAPFYPADDPASVAGLMRAWRAFALDAPDEVSAEFLLWTVPPAPDFPEAIHGRRVAVMPTVWIGDPDEGERLLRPLRELAEPLADLSGPIPYEILQTAFDGIFQDPALQYYWKSLYLDALGDEAIERIVARGLERPSPLTLVAVWQLGGAMARVPAAATAFGRRDHPFLLSIDSTWSGPAGTEENVAWTREAWEEMHAYSSGGLYLNFPGLGEEREALVRAAYGDNYARLAELKARYDPGNLFSLNQNIAPAA